MSSPLVKQLAESLGLSPEEAQDALDAWVTNLHERAATGAVDVVGLGSFGATDDAPLAFTPAAPLDFLVNQGNTPPLPVEPAPSPADETAPPAVEQEEPQPEDAAQAEPAAELEPAVEVEHENEESLVSPEPEPIVEEDEPSAPPPPEKETAVPVQTEAEAVVEPAPEAPTDSVDTPETEAEPEDLNKDVWQPPQRKESALGTLPEDPYEEADFSVVPNAPPESSSASFLSELIDLASGPEATEDEEEPQADGPFGEEEQPQEHNEESKSEKAVAALPIVEAPKPEIIADTPEPEPVLTTSEPPSPAPEPSPPPATPYAPPRQPDRPAQRYTPAVDESEESERSPLLMGVAGIVVLAVVAWLAWTFLRPSPTPDLVVPPETQVAETPPATPQEQPADSTTLAVQPDSTVAPTPGPEPEVVTPAPSSELFGTAGFEQVAGTYTIVVGSATSLEAANAALPRFRDQGLRTAILHGTYREITSYRIAVGQFSTKEAAVEARAEHANLLVEGAWVMRVFQRFTIYNSPSD